MSHLLKINPMLVVLFIQILIIIQKHIYMIILIMIIDIILNLNQIK